MQLNRYTAGSISKAMLSFVGPHLLGMILQNLYGTVDLLVVGKFATTSDVSAVTVGSQLMAMPTQLIVGLATGIIVLTGTYLGAKKTERISSVLGTAVLFFAGVTTLLTAICLSANRLGALLMQTPQEAVEATRRYFFICTCGIPFIAGYNVITGILTGLGNTKTPFIFISIACFINITMDVILVKFLRMGAAGAAIATMMAQGASMIFSLCYIRRHPLCFVFTSKDIAIDRPVLKRMAATGVPIAGQNVLVSASFLFITAVINRLGLNYSAAVGVVEKLIGFSIMPACAFSTAVAAISAQNIGAGKWDRARKSMWAGTWLSLIPAMLIFLVSQFAGNLLTGLFSPDPAVIGLAARYLRSYALDSVLVCFTFCMNGYFNSSGYSWFAMAHSLGATFLIRIPLVYLFGWLHVTDLFVFGWAPVSSSCVSLVACSIFYLCIRHRLRNPPTEPEAAA